MSLKAHSFVNLQSRKMVEFSAAAFSDETLERTNTVHAIAGIGNPDRFFSLLRSAGFVIMAHAFPDHHAFSKDDMDFAGGLPVIMTEKDAVKCGKFATDRHWYLKVSAQLPADFWQLLSTKLAVASSSLRV